jgi:hypothetical protein
MTRLSNLLTAILIAFLALSCVAQPERSSAPKATGCPTNRDPQHADRLQIHAIRTIEDFATHRRWLLEKDVNRPAGPASLVPLPPDESCAFPKTEPGAAPLHVKFPGPPIPVIRAGDALIVSEHTSVSDTQLEAIALSAAGVGEAMTIRLKIGGGPLHAIAIAPSRASLLAQPWESHP